MNKKIRDILLASMLIGADGYTDYIQVEDIEVSECLAKMYLWMKNDDPARDEELYTLFDEKYQQLNEEQKKIVNEEYSKLTNEEEKEKEEKNKQKALEIKRKV